MFTLLVKDMYSSYKSFCITLYQIQTKYRDEARPLRRRSAAAKFVMKGCLLLRTMTTGAERVQAEARPTNIFSAWACATSSCPR